MTTRHNNFLLASLTLCSGLSLAPQKAFAGIVSQSGSSTSHGIHKVSYACESGVIGYGQPVRYDECRTVSGTYFRWTVNAEGRVLANHPFVIVDKNAGLKSGLFAFPDANVLVQGRYNKSGANVLTMKITANPGHSVNQANLEKATLGAVRDEATEIASHFQLAGGLPRFELGHTFLASSVEQSITQPVVEKVAAAETAPFPKFDVPTPFALPSLYSFPEDFSVPQVEVGKKTSLRPRATSVDTLRRTPPISLSQPTGRPSFTNAPLAVKHHAAPYVGPRDSKDLAPPANQNKRETTIPAPQIQTPKRYAGAKAHIHGLVHDVGLLGMGLLLGGAIVFGTMWRQQRQAANRYEALAKTFLSDANKVLVARGYPALNAVDLLSGKSSLAGSAPPIDASQVDRSAVDPVPAPPALSSEEASLMRQTFVLAQLVSGDLRVTVGQLAPEVEAAFAAATQTRGELFQKVRIAGLLLRARGASDVDRRQGEGFINLADQIKQGGPRNEIITNGKALQNPRPG